jgi:hypothetical protein
MREIDLQSRTLYAELLEQLQTMDASRTIAALKGTFSIKKVNGEDYVYFEHYTPGGRLEQLYIGKKGEKTSQLMRSYDEGRADAREMGESVRRLSAQVSAGIDVPTDKATIRVIRSLSDAGVFRAGAVLVGTHAYKVIGVMLGVVWPAGTMATSDIDIATPRTVSVAVPMVTTAIPEAVKSLEMGFFPVPALDPRQPSTAFAIRRHRLRLDILTPKTTDSSDPVFIPRFGCAALPMDYLSYLIESPVQAVLVDTEPVLINVPQPVRYALHKLIVSQKRDRSRGGKSEKDMDQAYRILSLIRESRPYEIGEAWSNLISRGPKWTKPAEQGLAQMGKRFGKLGIEPDESIGA